MQDDEIILHQFCEESKPLTFSLGVYRLCKGYALSIINAQKGGNPMGFNEYLKNSGVLECARDAHEYRRLKDLGTALYRLVGNYKKDSFSISEIELEFIKQIIVFCQKLFLLDIRAPEHIPYSVINGLVHVLFRGLKDGEEIVFVSLASNALASDGKLREKKQYELPDKILSFLMKVNAEIPFQWRYEILLADHDFLFPKNKFSLLWKENLVFLQSKTDVPARLLSELITDTELQAVKKTLSRHSKVLDSEVEKFTKNIFFSASFKATPERNRHQMLLYASVGLWLERNLKTCVVLDIQKQMYPYEQPYFNRFRKDPLPLCRCAKK